MNSDELKYLNLTGLYSRHQHKLKETSRIESTEADCLSIPQNSCWQGPLGPSAPAPAPAGTHRAGCPGPRPGSSGRSPRRRPHSLWAACASALSLHSTEVLLVFRGKIRWLWYPAVLIAEQKVKGRAVLGPAYGTRGRRYSLVWRTGVSTQPSLSSQADKDVDTEWCILQSSEEGKVGLSVLCVW